MHPFFVWRNQILRLLSFSIRKYSDEILRVISDQEEGVHLHRSCSSSIWVIHGLQLGYSKRLLVEPFTDQLHRQRWIFKVRITVDELL